MLRTRYLTALVLALTLPIAACGDDGSPSGNDNDPLAALVGSWTAQSFVYTADADPNISVNLTSFGFGIQSLAVAADGTFTGSVILPDEQGNAQTIPLTGSLTNVTQTSLTVAFTGVAAQALDDLDVTYTVSGSTLTFEADDVTFDFTLQGNTPIPASLRVVLVKS